MSVILRVTETRLNTPYLTEEYEGTTTFACVEGYIRQGLDWRFDENVIRNLLNVHDDVHIGSPTWDVHFEFTMKE